MNAIIKCGHCGATFNDTKVAQEHAKVCDINSVAKMQGGEDGKVHKCVKCNAVFATEKACFDHKKNCIC